MEKRFLCLLDVMLMLYFVRKRAKYFALWLLSCQIFSFILDASCVYYALLFWFLTLKKTSMLWIIKKPFSCLLRTPFSPHSADLVITWRQTFFFLCLFAPSHPCPSTWFLVVHNIWKRSFFLLFVSLCLLFILQDLNFQKNFWKQCKGNLII